MNEKRKKTITITVIGIIFLLLILITVTYAYFSASSKAEKQQVTTAKEELIVTPTSDPIHISNIKPINNFLVNGDDLISDDPTDVNKKNEDVVTIPISVESKSTVDINYNLTIKPENLNLNTGNDADDKELIGGTTEDIKWVLYKLDGKNGSSVSPESYGDFYNTTKEQNMITEVTIDPNTTHYYILFIYIEDEDVTQNKLQNITFDVVIGANTKPIDIVGRKLSEVILENNIIKDREPNFNPIKYVGLYDENYTGLSDKGLFKIKDKDVYYFRGAAIRKDNSNESNKTVFFGKHNESDNIYDVSRYQTLPILWSILRINADNSITLILDDFVYPQNFTIENANYEGSNIQELLNTWYEDTFTEKEKRMIQTTTFCNDTSNNYQGVSDRLNKEIPAPTLDCPEKDKIEAYIGLPTADEMFFAGFTSKYKTNNSIPQSFGPYGYRFNNAFNTAFTMSPASENNLYVCTGYYCSESNNGGIYPVITLKPDVTISESVQYDKDNIYNSEFGKYYFVGYDE